MSKCKKNIALLMTLIFIASTLSACEHKEAPASANTQISALAATKIPAVMEYTPKSKTEQPVINHEASAAASDSYMTLAEELGLTEQQLNSFSMLYHLAITAEEIRISKDNRLMLDDIYTSLLNDINPGAVDEITQDHLRNLRDIIKTYLNISVKRDRLQYIYNQDKAAAIRSAVPNPLAILSIANALDWKRLAVSVVYTVVDSYNHYKDANASIDREFLINGWELNDEETANIQKNRDRAFDYMVDIVQAYELDGYRTLSEKSIETFAQICAIESPHEKIRRLKAEEQTYGLLGNYWLELAACYFDTSDYQACLNCIEEYNGLATGIYRLDYGYVQILPKAIVSAQAVYTGNEYVANIRSFADDIMKNTTSADWSARYFAAQAYLDLYGRTNNKDFLNKAYNIAYDNVTVLLDEQRSLNSAYLSDVQEVQIKEPDYRFMNAEEKKSAESAYNKEKERLQAYNNGLKKARETELPTLYEPLVLNCELLFALADEIGLESKEQDEIDKILQTSSREIFLTESINNHFSFASHERDHSIQLTKNEVVIPVCLLSAQSEVLVEIEQNDEVMACDDCVVSKVERKGTGIDEFYAHITSKLMNDYSWSADSRVTVTISNGSIAAPIRFRFKVSEYADRWILDDKVVFEAE